VKNFDKEVSQRTTPTKALAIGSIKFQATYAVLDPLKTEGIITGYGASRR